MPSLEKRLSHKSSNLSSKLRNSTRLSSFVSFDKSSKPKHPRSPSSSSSVSPSSSPNPAASSGFSNISTPTLISSSATTINGIPLTSRAKAAQAAQAAAKGNALIESTASSSSSAQTHINQPQSSTDAINHNIDLHKNSSNQNSSSNTTNYPTNHYISESRAKLDKIINFIPVPPPSQLIRPNLNEMQGAVIALSQNQPNQTNIIHTPFKPFSQLEHNTANVTDASLNTDTAGTSSSLQGSATQNNNPQDTQKMDNTSNVPIASPMKHTSSQNTVKPDDKENMIALASTLFLTLWLIRNVVYSYEMTKNTNANSSTSTESTQSHQLHPLKGLQKEINSHIHLRKDEVEIELAESARQSNVNYAYALHNGTVEHNDFDAKFLSDLIPNLNRSRCSTSSTITNLISPASQFNPPFSSNQRPPPSCAVEMDRIPKSDTAPNKIPTNPLPNLSVLAPLPDPTSMGVFLTDSLYIPKTLWSSVFQEKISPEIIEQRLECLREFIRIGEAFLGQQLLVRTGYIGLSSWEDVNLKTHNPCIRASNQSFGDKPTVKGALRPGVQGPNFGLRSGYNRSLTTSFITSKTSYLLDNQNKQLKSLESEINMTFIFPIDSSAYSREEVSSVVTTSGTHMIASASSNLNNLEPAHPHPPSRTSFISRARSRSSSSSSSNYSISSLSHNIGHNSKRDSFSDVGSDVAGGISTLQCLEKIHRDKIEIAKNASQLSRLSNMARRVANYSSTVSGDNSNRVHKRRHSLASSIEFNTNRLHKNEHIVPVGRGFPIPYSVDDGSENVTESERCVDRNASHNTTLMPTTLNRSLSSFGIIESHTSSKKNLGFSNPVSHPKHTSCGPTMITSSDVEHDGSIYTASSDSSKKEKGFSKLFRKSRLSLGSNTNSSSPSMITSDDLRNEHHRPRMSVGGGSFKHIHKSNNSKAEMITSQDFQQQQEAKLRHSLAAKTEMDMAEYNEFRANQEEAPPGSIGAGVPIGTVFVQKRGKHSRSSSKDLAPVLSAVSIASSSSSPLLDTDRSQFSSSDTSASSGFKSKHRPSLSIDSTSSTVSTQSTSSRRSSGSGPSVASSYAHNSIIGAKNASPYISNSFEEDEEEDQGNYKTEKSHSSRVKQLELKTNCSVESLGPPTATVENSNWISFGRPSSGESAVSTDTSLGWKSSTSDLVEEEVHQKQETPEEDIDGNVEQDDNNDNTDENKPEKSEPANKAFEVPDFKKPRALSSGLPMRGVPRIAGTRSSGIRRGSYHVSGFENASPDHKRDIRQVEMHAAQEDGFRTTCFILSGVGDRPFNTTATQTAFGILKSFNSSISSPDVSVATKYGYVFGHEKIEDKECSLVLAPPKNKKRYASFTTSTTTTRDETGCPIKPTIATYLEVLDHMKDVLVQILGKEEVCNLFETAIEKEIRERRKAEESTCTDTNSAKIAQEKDDGFHVLNIYGSILLDEKTAWLAKKPNSNNCQHPDNKQDEELVSNDSQVNVNTSDSLESASELLLPVSISPLSATISLGSNSEEKYTEPTQSQIQNNTCSLVSEDKEESLSDFSFPQKKHLSLEESRSNFGRKQADTLSNDESGQEPLGMLPISLKTENPSDDNALGSLGINTYSCNADTKLTTGCEMEQEKKNTVSKMLNTPVITDLELQELEIGEEWAHGYALFAARIISRVLLKDVSCLISMYQTSIREWILS